MIYLIKSSIMITPLVVVFFLVGRILRGWNLSQCYACGARSLRPARVSGFLERVGGVLWIRPLRCDCCRERCFAIRPFGAPPEPDALESLKTRKVVQIVVKRRKGAINGVVIRRVAIKPSDSATNRKPGPLTASPAMLRT